MNNILGLITGKDLIILDYLIEKPYHLRELARKSGFSIGKIHEFVKKYKEKNIILTENRI